MTETVVPSKTQDDGETDRIQIASAETLSVDATLLGPTVTREAMWGPPGSPGMVHDLSATSQNLAAMGTATALQEFGDGPLDDASDTAPRPGEGMVPHFGPGYALALDGTALQEPAPGMSPATPLGSYPALSDPMFERRATLAADHQAFSPLHSQVAKPTSNRTSVGGQSSPPSLANGTVTSFESDTAASRHEQGSAVQFRQLAQMTVAPASTDRSTNQTPSADPGTTVTEPFSPNLAPSAPFVGPISNDDGSEQTSAIEGSSTASASRVRAQTSISTTASRNLTAIPTDAEHHATPDPFANAPEQARGNDTQTATQDEVNTPESVSREFASQQALPDLSAAHLLHSLGRSEMQVHLNASEFGHVSVHATYGRDGIAAQISLQGTELGSALHAALSQHVPSMEEKLSATQGMRATVTVDTAAHAGSGDANGQRSGASPNRRPLSNPRNLAALSTTGALSAPLSAATVQGSADRRRLDIHI